ncbi:MAG TPA: hypothetical protein VGI40_20220 [Pirellulaceae bacterium]|jgi:hypothetical protein
MRYRLRTLLIVLALGPPALAWCLSLYRNYTISRRIEELMLSLPPGIDINDGGFNINANNGPPLDLEAIDKTADEIRKLRRQRSN